jgi:hypothetical protein
VASTELGILVSRRVLGEEGGGSDRLIDAVVPQGSPEEIAAEARAHLEAGAESPPRAEWTALAAELIA